MLLVLFLIAKDLARTFSSQFDIFNCCLLDVTCQIPDWIVFITYLRTSADPFIYIKGILMKQNYLVIRTINALSCWTLTVSWGQLWRWSNWLTFRHKINWINFRLYWGAFYCARIFNLIFFLCIFLKNSSSKTFLLLLMLKSKFIFLNHSLFT